MSAWRDGYTPSAKFAKKIHEFVGHVFAHRIFIGGLECIRDMGFGATGLFPARGFFIPAIAPTFLVRDQALRPLHYLEPHGFGRNSIINA
jgi:hypothetical protein